MLQIISRKPILIDWLIHPPPISFATKLILSVWVGRRPPTKFWGIYFAKTLLKFREKKIGPWKIQLSPDGSTTIPHCIPVWRLAYSHVFASSPAPRTVVLQYSAGGLKRRLNGGVLGPLFYIHAIVHTVVLISVHMKKGGSKMWPIFFLFVDR